MYRNRIKPIPSGKGPMISEIVSGVGSNLNNSSREREGGGTRKKEPFSFALRHVYIIYILYKHTRKHFFVRAFQVVDVMGAAVAVATGCRRRMTGVRHEYIHPNVPPRCCKAFG